MKPRKKVYFDNSKEIIEQASKVVKDVATNYVESLNEEIASTIKNSISINRRLQKLKVANSIAQLNLLQRADLEEKNLITKQEAQVLIETHLSPEISEQKKTTNENKKRRKGYCNPR